MPAGEGEVLIDQRIRIVDPANHADGVSAQIGADQKWLRLAVADAADGRDSPHLLEDMLKPRTERSVLNVVNFALQTDLRVKRRHPTPARAEVGMVVSTEEDVGHTVIF